MIISPYSELFECKNGIVLEEGSRLGKQQELFPKFNTSSFIAILLKYIIKSPIEIQVFINFYVRILDKVKIFIND